MGGRGLYLIQYRRECSKWLVKRFDKKIEHKGYANQHECVLYNMLTP